MTKNKLERIVKFEPAFDKRSDDPKKNYGIHGVNLRMILKGEEGAVSFTLYTNWQLPHVTEEQDKRFNPKFPHLLCHPMPVDIGYHSPKPFYKDQFSKEDCEYLNGERCYGDGSVLDAEDYFKILVEKGDDGFWKEMEKYYKSLFLKKSRKK